MTAADRLKYNECLEKTGNEDAAFSLYLQYKILTDLFFFGTEILGWKNSKDKRGKKFVDFTFHKWLAGILQKDEDKCILVPREHLKSTWLKLRIAQKILIDPNIRIGLFSISARLVEQQLADIKRILATPILLRLFPDVVPEPGKDYKNWDKSTANLLTIKRDGQANIQADQVTALGAGAKITGFHIDEAYLDDIIDATTVTTAEQMKKSEDYWAYIQSILVSGGTTTIVGTHYHYNDLYSKIIKEHHMKKSQIYKRAAIENGKILYSSFFTKEDLEQRKRRQSNYIFNCQYLLNPIPLEDQIFPPPQPTFTTLPADSAGYEYYITVDPAATATTHSDFSGVVVSAKNRINQLFILEAIPVKKTNIELAKLIIRKAVQYQPRKIGIEFGLQESLRFVIDTARQDYERQNNCMVPLPIEPIPVSRRMSKATRINLTLGAFLREGRVQIHTSCTDLINQMDSFTGKGNEKDDLIDAAAMVFSVINNYAYQYWVKRSYLGEGYQNFFDIFKDDTTFEWRKEFAS